MPKVRRIPQFLGVATCVRSSPLVGRSAMVVARRHASQRRTEMARWKRPTTARRISRVAALGPSPFSLVRTLPLIGPLHPYDFVFSRRASP